VIDLETVQETDDGTWFDRLTALLIGLIAVIAAGLVLVQTTNSLTEARANAQATRLAAESSARLHAGSVFLQNALGALQQAVVLSLEGTSRQIVGLQRDDALEQAKGGADTAAGDRLLGIAQAMGAEPTADGPVDAYVRDLLRDPTGTAAGVVVEQNRQVDLAHDAGDRAGRAVLGLSFIALAGVLVGLTAVLGEGRAGRLTLVMAYLGLGSALVMLLAAVFVPPSPFVAPTFELLPVPSPSSPPSPSPGP
jgi:hypothetical protein